MYGTVIQDAFNAILAEEKTNINLLSGTRLVDNGIGVQFHNVINGKQAFFSL
jgi:hypothetical protein